MRDEPRSAAALLKRIGRRVRELRMQQGRTQAELASVLGHADYKYVQQIEAGGVNVTVGTLCAVAAALSVDVAALFVRPRLGSARHPGRPRKTEFGASSTKTRRRP